MERKVALIVESSSGYGRGIFLGIIRYMRIHNDWSVFLEQRDIHRKPPEWLANWDGDGIISRTTTPELAQAVRTNGIPFVELTDRFDVSLSTPTVRSDDLTIGKLAAEHLLERGFERFGFCGYEGEAWSERRESGFVATIEAAGKSVVTYRSPWRGPQNHSWEQERDLIANWLEEIPRPFGVMACNDFRGKHVLDAAIYKRLAVPEEIAVVGVDDDELLCQACSPPLSSVIPNASSVGYRGAELLSELMDSSAKHQFHKPNLVAPLGIAPRQSSDVVAIDDPEVAAALAFIRKNACYRKINVEDIFAKCRGFKNIVGTKIEKIHWPKSTTRDPSRTN